MNFEAIRRTRNSRADAKAETRQRLLDSAQTVFTTVGYQGAKLDDIAARAGFTKGALYWHFPSKQAIFLALIADAIKVNLETLSGLLAEDGSAEFIRARMGQWIDGIDDREILPRFGVELEIEARRDPSFRAIYEGMIGKHEEALNAFLERYFKVAELDPVMPIPALSSTLLTIFKGFALARQNRPGTPVTSAGVARLLMGLPVT